MEQQESPYYAPMTADYYYEMAVSRSKVSDIACFLKEIKRILSLLLAAHNQNRCRYYTVRYYKIVELLYPASADSQRNWVAASGQIVVVSSKYLYQSRERAEQELIRRKKRRQRKIERRNRETEERFLAWQAESFLDGFLKIVQDVLSLQNKSRN